MDINTINIVTLAYLGDSIYEVYIRETLIKKGIAKVEDLTKIATKYVSAKGQANILKQLIETNYLTDTLVDKSVIDAVEYIYDALAEDFIGTINDTILNGDTATS